eukprot:9482687-Pyramimonas_sp.AAC.1
MARAANQDGARGAASQYLRRPPSVPKGPNWCTEWRHQSRTPGSRWEVLILRSPSAKLPRDGQIARDTVEALDTVNSRTTARHRKLPHHRIR